MTEQPRSIRVATLVWATPLMVWAVAATALLIICHTRAPDPPQVIVREQTKTVTTAFPPVPALPVVPIPPPAPAQASAPAPARESAHVPEQASERPRARQARTGAHARATAKLRKVWRK